MNEEVLTLDEKQNIARQFIKNLAYSRYNVQVSLIAENAVVPPNQSNIDSFTKQLADIDAKIAAVEAELATMEGE